MNADYAPADHNEIDLGEKCPGCGLTIYDERGTSINDPLEGVDWDDLTPEQQAGKGAPYGPCPARIDSYPACSEGDHPNDDNPGKPTCKTCEDWT